MVRNRLPLRVTVHSVHSLLPKLHAHLCYLGFRGHIVNSGQFHIKRSNCKGVLFYLRVFDEQQRQEVLVVMGPGINGNL